MAFIEPMNNSNEHQTWFVSWFDSPYYHLLYKDRNDSEAQNFLDALIQYLNPSPQAAILDMACGRGRHAIYLSQKGFDVTGVDLAASSIAHAKQSSDNKVHFKVQDIREPDPTACYDVVLNLFTSFGYFEDLNDNLRVLQAVRQALNPQGLFVMDFLHADRTIAKLVPFEQKKIGGIPFQIKKRLEDKTIIKTISFDVDGAQHQYEERVTAFSPDDLHTLFKKSGLTIIDTFGNYQLEPLNANSDRLILVAKMSDQ